MAAFIQLEGILHELDLKCDLINLIGIEGLSNDQQVQNKSYTPKKLS